MKNSIMIDSRTPNCSNKSWFDVAKAKSTFGYRLSSHLAVQRKRGKGRKPCIPKPKGFLYPIEDDNQDFNGKER